MNGKGDKNRTSDIKRYKDNYDKIFGNTTFNAAKRDTRPGQSIQERKMGRSAKRTR